MKSLAATRSEQLLVKSRAVKQKKKSEEEFKEKEKQKVTEEDDRKWKENNVANVEEEGCPFDDFDISKECQGLRILNCLAPIGKGSVIKYLLHGAPQDIGRGAL